MRHVVPVWEYKKINLNDVPRRGDDIAVLCAAGEDGWELIHVLPNNVAYLKRKHYAEEDGVAQVEGLAEEPGTGVKVKYRDPATGDAWSGRGRMATWLKRKQEAGEDIEKYRV